MELLLQRGTGIIFGDIGGFVLGKAT